MGIVLIGLFLVLGIEVWLALRREYLPTDHPLDLNRTFGSSAGSPLRFAVLGDSTSAGLGVLDSADAYPTLLARRLVEETGRSVELNVLGISGATTQDVRDEQVPKAVTMDPDLIFIGIGANDVTHLTSLGDIRTYMRHTLEDLHKTGAVIVVAGAPDMRVFAWHQPLRSLAYLRGKQVTAAIEEVARSAGVPTVDLDDETGHYFAAEPETHFSEDRFHPSALGYERWADAIFPVLIEAWKNEG